MTNMLDRVLAEARSAAAPVRLRDLATRLSVEESAELQELLPDGWNDDFDVMDQTAATCCLGLGIDVTDPLPFALRERIKADERRANGSERQ